ncbi:hypothetical protein B0H14DRAFT_2819038 [Mycena olivaceomarginata]|nr:hypothetical protein B0H14DRAFT_2819038 [Mycena olivaceomarginata]
MRDGSGGAAQRAQGTCSGREWGGGRGDVASAKGKGRRDGRKGAVVDDGKRGGCGCSGTAVVRQDQCEGAQVYGRELDGRAATETGAQGYKRREDGTGKAAHGRDARSRWMPNGRPVSRWMEMGLWSGPKWRLEGMGVAAHVRRARQRCRRGGVWTRVRSRQARWDRCCRSEAARRCRTRSPCCPSGHWRWVAASRWGWARA